MCGYANKPAHRTPRTLVTPSSLLEANSQLQVTTLDAPEERANSNWRLDWSIGSRHAS